MSIGADEQAAKDRSVPQRTAEKAVRIGRRLMEHLNHIPSGGTMAQGGWIESQNKKYELHMQRDGNLVLYEHIKPSLPTDPDLRPVWDTGTQLLSPEDRPVTANMQRDGNFVLRSRAGKAVWETKTSRFSGARIILENDRNLVIRDRFGQAVWDSGTPVKSVPVPDVVEELVRDARAEIERAGLVPDPRGDTSGRPGPPWVVSQQPRGGSLALIESTVELHCSSRIRD